jgi:tetratricopeptide (TPR) repeat protein
VKDPELILKDNPGSVVFAPYAEVLARNGQIEQAMEILRKGIEANPFYAPGYSVLATILLQRNSTDDEAVEALLTALKIDPQRPRDLLCLGNRFLRSDPVRSDTFLQYARIFEPFSELPSALDEQKPECSGQEKNGRKELNAGISEPEGIETFMEAKGESSEKPSFDEEKHKYPRPLDDTPVEEHDITETEGIDTEKDDFFDKSVIDELEEEDFLDVIDEYGAAKRTEEDLEEVIEDFSKDEITELPVPVKDPYDEENGTYSPPEKEKSEQSFEDSSKTSVETPSEPEDSKNAIEIPEEGDEENTQTPLEENPIVRITGEEEDEDIENDSPDFYDRTVVDELEKEEFYDIIEKYGRTRGADEDVDEIVESFGKDRDIHVPPPKPEKIQESGENKSSENEKEPPEKEISASSVPMNYNEPHEFGVVDEIEDSAEEKILEIKEEEEYDLSRYGFGLSSDNSPVLSEQERKELLSLESGETEDGERGDGKGIAGTTDTAQISVENSGSPFLENFYGRLSKEEIDVLNSTEKETLIDDLLSDMGPDIEAGPALLEKTGKNGTVNSLKEENRKSETGDRFSSDRKNGNRHAKTIGSRREEDSSKSKKALEGNDVYLDGLRKTNIETPDIEVFRGMAHFSKGSSPRSTASLAIPKMGEQENEASLDSLVDDYRNIVEKKYPSRDKTEKDTLKKIPPLSVRKPAKPAEKGGKPHTSNRASESYTATMAEIYVSQGHINGAIDIYTALMKRDPGNKNLQERLKELQTLVDDQRGSS